MQGGRRVGRERWRKRKWRMGGGKDVMQGEGGKAKEKGRDVR